MAVNQQQRSNFSARDLVTQADPSITSAPAIEALTSAFAKGAITTDDIMKRMGTRAHKQARAEDVVRERTVEDIKDPMKAAGREAIAAQQKDMLGRALAVGAPLPKDAAGDVDFDQLFAMGPQIKEFERREVQRAQRLTELQDAFDRAANKPPTGDRNIYVSWKGNQPLTPQEFQQERERLSAPSTFTDLFPQGAGQAQNPVGGTVAPGGEIIGSGAQIPDPGPVNIDGTPATPVAAPAAAPAAVPAAVAPAAAPAAVAAEPTADTFFPTRQGGAGDKSPTEVQTKAFMAGARFDQLEPILEMLEDSEYDLTGKWETARRWIADRVPDWAPWVGHANLPGEAQMYQAAAKGWAQGLLRLESGAAITVKEEASYIETFMPRAGDSPATITLKREMRRTMADAIEKVAHGVKEAEAAGDKAGADQLRQEYEAARDSMIDYVNQQAAVDTGVSPEVAAGIRQQGVVQPVRDAGDFEGTSFANMPGFSGMGADGLPAFDKPQPLVQPK